MSHYSDVHIDFPKEDNFSNINVARIHENLLSGELSRLKNLEEAKEFLVSAGTYDKKYDVIFKENVNGK